MSLSYLKDLGERVLTTFVVTVVPFLAGDSVDLWHLDWKLIISLGATAALGSLLKGLLARFVGSPDTASLSK